MQIKKIMLISLILATSNSFSNTNLNPEKAIIPVELPNAKPFKQKRKYVRHAPFITQQDLNKLIQTMSNQSVSNKVKGFTAGVVFAVLIGHHKQVFNYSKTALKKMQLFLDENLCKDGQEIKSQINDFFKKNKKENQE